MKTRLLLPIAIASIACACAQARRESPLPQPVIDEIDGHIGKRFWPPEFIGVAVCDKPLLVDRQCQNHKESFTVIGKADDAGFPYFRIRFDGGNEGYISFAYVASLLAEDPALKRSKADADCRRRGQPQIGMTLAQVRASCWGEPNHVNRTENAAAVLDQLVYGRDRYIYLRNGAVTSIQTSGSLR